MVAFNNDEGLLDLSQLSLIMPIYVSFNGSLKLPVQYLIRLFSRRIYDNIVAKKLVMKCIL
jgi:hypothetical protein